MGTKEIEGRKTLNQPRVSGSHSAHNSVVFLVRAFFNKKCVCVGAFRAKCGEQKGRLAFEEKRLRVLV